MPRSYQEGAFIKLFLSAYENGSWVDALHQQPDKVERTKPAVDWLAKRKSDGKTLVIEHTIIEPFVGERADFAFFEAAFLQIERDTSLLVAGRWIQVFVPVGVLQNQPKVAQELIVQSVHAWLKVNRLLLPDGISEHRCAVKAVPGKPPFDITLNLDVVPLQTGLAAEAGSLHVRRQQVEDNLDAVIEKTLRRKLPKLVNTTVEKRILLLERQHMNLYPHMILGEIEKRRSSFPDLAHVDEIWIIETIFYGTAFGGTYLRFEQYENATKIRSFVFNDGKLFGAY